LLAAAFDNSTLIADEYPSCKPHDVLEAIAAYRGADGWQGAVHVPDAHHDKFRTHPPGAEARKHLDDLIDTSEDPLDRGEDQGDENSVDDDLPIT
jgi:hypothetical protein